MCESVAEAHDAWIDTSQLSSWRDLHAAPHDWIPGSLRRRLRICPRLKHRAQHLRTGSKGGCQLLPLRSILVAVLGSVRSLALATHAVALLRLKWELRYVATLEVTKDEVP